MRILLVSLLAVTLFTPFLRAQVDPAPRAADPTPVILSPAQAVTESCGHDVAQDALRDYLDRIEAGLLPDPQDTMPSSVPPSVGWQTGADGGAPQMVTPDDFFLYEDSEALLLTPYSFDDLLPLMVDASNALMVEHGDNYDYIGFWLSYEPSATIGAAFYLGIENQVQGIGQGTYNFRPGLGLAGDNVEGFVMMWDVNTSYWQPGTAGDADFTRLAIHHEFEHRFGLFLPPLANGVALQGDNGDCGREAHWGWYVDGQGSAMELANWVGTGPAVPSQLFVSFNADLGGVWSWTDLYLMGYATAAEMDAGNSELRVMNDAVDCTQSYFGPITDFTSQDIIDTAGERIPDAADAQKKWRAGWVMLHLPGDEPTPDELDKAAAILNQSHTDWADGSLSRSVISHTLEPSLSAFQDVGMGLSGNTTPVLEGEGSLDDNAWSCVQLRDAAPSSPAVLIAGLQELNQPFFGGTLVPSPDALQPLLQTDIEGALEVCDRFPSGIPAGTKVYFQVWVEDPGAPYGYAASNGLAGMTPTGSTP